jgi:hypothetical protein
MSRERKSLCETQSPIRQQAAVIERQDTTGGTQGKAEVENMAPWDQKKGDNNVMGWQCKAGNPGVHAAVHYTFGISQPTRTGTGNRRLIAHLASNTEDRCSLKHRDVNIQNLSSADKGKTCHELNVMLG